MPKQRVAARPGDWKCRSRLCQAHNFASKTKCYKCGNPKPGTDGARPGDWKCTVPSCQANNYASKFSCFKCGAPRPKPKNGDADGAEGEEGGDNKVKKERRKKKKRQTFQNTGVYFENLPKGRLLFEVQQIVRELCMPYGTLRKITVYRSKNDPNLSQGDALAVFTNSEDADKACIALHTHERYRASRATFQPKAKKPAAGGDVVGGQSGNQSQTASKKQPNTAKVSTPVPVPSIASSSTSDTVFIGAVFDIFAETSKDEAELRKKCASFGKIAKWYVDDDGNVLVQFSDEVVAFMCADALHGTKFAGKPLVCDFVESIEKPKSVAPRTVIIRNAFDPQQANSDPKFIPQLEVDFRAACGQYGPVKTIDALAACGEVRVRYSSGLCAADCKRGMDRRPFDGRRLAAHTIMEVEDDAATNIKT